MLTRSVGVQVKTTQRTGDSWMVKKFTSEDLASNLFFYLRQLERA